MMYSLCRSQSVLHPHLRGAGRSPVAEPMAEANALARWRCLRGDDTWAVMMPQPRQYLKVAIVTGVCT